MAAPRSVRRRITFPKDRKDDQQARPDAPSVPRRVYIKPSDIDQFGWTDGCQRCEHAKKYGHGQTSKPHSEICRNRIMAEMAKTDEGRLRIERAGLRADQYAADEIERADNNGGQEPQGERKEDVS